MKKKINGKDRKPMTNGFIQRVENVSVLPETMKRNQRRRSMPNFAVRQPVAFVVKK